MSYLMPNVVQLPNRIPVLLLKTNRSSDVQFRALYDTGSIHESARHAGLAHFVEHMILRGSNCFPETTQVNQLIDRLGAKMSASTNYDETDFIIQVPSDKLLSGMKLLTDLLLFPLFNPSHVEIERQVVLSEIGSIHNQLSVHSFDLLMHCLYPDSPYGRNILGTEQTLRRIGSEELRAFWKRHYAANGLVLSVSGEFDEVEVVNSLADSFGRLSRTRRRKTVSKVLTRHSVNKPRQIFESCVTASQAYLSFGFLTDEAVNATDVNAMQLLAHLLGGSWSSRLWSNIREQNGLAYSLGADSYNYGQVGQLIIRAVINPESQEQAIKIILTELANICRHGVSTDELTRCKNSQYGQLQRSLDHPHNLADYYTDQLLFSGKVTKIERYPMWVKSVTPEAIQRVAKQFLRPDNLHLAIIAPSGNAPSMAWLESLLGG
ncbi:MAG: pitrilysin family protein [Patescibacteria group bacterium]